MDNDMGTGDDNQPLHKCPCGLTKELCGQKHVTLDRDMTQFRDDLGKLRIDCDQNIKDVEGRMEKGQDVCETHMLERMGFQQEIAYEITSNIKSSYKEGLLKLTDGLNLHRKDIVELQKNVPTKAIDRLVSLEKWKWWLMGIGTALGAAQIMMWKFYNHLALEYEQALKLLETAKNGFGG